MEEFSKNRAKKEAGEVFPLEEAMPPFSLQATNQVSGTSLHQQNHAQSINLIASQSVRRRANYKCEYCQALELVSAAKFAIDYIIPQALGGTDDHSNLTLSCMHCRDRRYSLSVKGILSLPLNRL